MDRIPPELLESIVSYSTISSMSSAFIWVYEGIYNKLIGKTPQKSEDSEELLSTFKLFGITCRIQTFSIGYIGAGICGSYLGSKLYSQHMSHFIKK